MTGVIGLGAGLLIGELWRSDGADSKEVAKEGGGAEVNYARGRRSSGALRKSRRGRHRAKSFNGVSRERMQRLAKFEHSLLTMNGSELAAFVSMQRELIEWSDQEVMTAFSNQEIFDEDNPVDMAILAEASRRNPQEVAAMFMQKGLRESDNAMDVLIGAWGETDPVAATKWALANIRNSDNQAMLLSLVKSYAADPQETQRMIQKAQAEGAEFSDEELAGMMLLGLKTRNPDLDGMQALKEAGLNVDPGLANQMEMMADVLMDPKVWYEQLQRGENVTLMIEILQETGDFSANPEQSIDLIMKCADQGLSVGSHTTAGLLASIAQRSPRAVLKAVKERGVPLEGQLLENVSEALVKTQSFEGHLQWVKGLSSPEQRNEAANAAWDWSSLSEDQMTQLKRAGITAPESPEVPNE